MAIYKDLRKMLRTHCEIQKAATKTVLALYEGNDYLAPQSNLQLRIFSDAILIYEQAPLEGEQLYNADALCSVLIAIYHHLLVHHGWLIRGAISVGELYVNRDIVFGDGLIRAYEAEQQQDWAAISIIDRYGMMDHPDGIYTCEYDIPWKTGKREGLVLNLFALEGRILPFADSVKKIQNLMDAELPQQVRQKLENTLKFLLYLEANGAPSKGMDMETFREWLNSPFVPTGLLKVIRSIAELPDEKADAPT